MTTVMSWGDSEGEHGRCDAKCHLAAEPECACMCGGRYHGRGLEPGGLARAVRDFGEEVLEAARARAAAEGLELKADSVGSILQQLHLEGAQGELFGKNAGRNRW